MARLIDADALMEFAKNRYGNTIIPSDITSFPTVDAVPVVRCKDCVHWYDREGVCLKIYSDGAVSPYAWQDRNEDDFCSYGERRTDGTI